MIALGFLVALGPGLTIILLATIGYGLVRHRERIRPAKVADSPPSRLESEGELDLGEPSSPRHTPPDRSPSPVRQGTAGVYRRPSGNRRTTGSAVRRASPPAARAAERKAPNRPSPGRSRACDGQPAPLSEVP